MWLCSEMEQLLDKNNKKLLSVLSAMICAKYLQF